MTKKKLADHKIVVWFHEDGNGVPAHLIVKYARMGYVRTKVGYEDDYDYVLLSKKKLTESQTADILTKYFGGGCDE